MHAERLHAMQIPDNMIFCESFSVKDFFKASPGASPGGQSVQESKPKEERIKQNIASASSPAPSTHTFESVLNHFCCEEKKKEKRK